MGMTLTEKYHSHAGKRNMEPGEINKAKLISAC